MQIAQYAKPLACVSSNRNCYVIIKLFERIEFNGEDVMIEYDCPLYTLTDNILCLLSSTVYASVSFIHQCSASCVFVTTTTGLSAERESSSSSHLAFKHDWTNTLYCLNIYCKKTVTIFLIHIRIRIELLFLMH